MRQFQVVLEYIDQIWLARCCELSIILEGTSFDALIERMSIAIQDVAEVELGHAGDIKVLISVRDRVKEIKAAG